MIARVLVSVLAIVLIPCVLGQANMNTSYTVDKVPLKDKALFLADFLVSHPSLFKKILKIQETSGHLLEIAANSEKFLAFANAALDRLPRLTKSPSTAAMVEVLIDEVDRLDLNDTIKFAQARNLTANSSEFNERLFRDVLKKYDTLRAVQRILSLRSARDLFQLGKSNISVTCYNDFTTFLDAIPGVQSSPRSDLNYTMMAWTSKMIDAYGKPPSGILRGENVWRGSPQECREVQAHLQAGEIIGNRTLLHSVHFGGKHCSVQVEWPKLLSKSLFFEKGAVKNVTWDVCVPDSCSSSDILEFFKLALPHYITQHVLDVNCHTTLGHLLVSTTSTPSSATSVPTTSVPTTTPNSGQSKTFSERSFSSCLGHNTGVDMHKWIHCVFAKFDGDLDGDISMPEWQSSYQGSTRTFRELDTNKNLKIDPVDLEYFFVIFDADGNGLIDMKEFRNGWATLQL